MTSENISDELGGTSGRFAVAQAIYRVFPARKPFVQRIRNMGLITGKLPNGPFPDDALLYRNDHTVEYTTPPHQHGLGTVRLRPDTSPVSGVLLLHGEDTDLISLAVRLPSGSEALREAIRQQVEAAYRSDPPKP